MVWVGGNALLCLWTVAGPLGASRALRSCLERLSPMATLPAEPCLWASILKRLRTLGHVAQQGTLSDSHQVSDMCPSRWLGVGPPGGAPLGQWAYDLAATLGTGPGTGLTLLARAAHRPRQQLLQRSCPLQGSTGNHGPQRGAACQSDLQWPWLLSCDLVICLHRGWGCWWGSEGLCSPIATSEMAPSWHLAVVPG